MHRIWRKLLKKHQYAWLTAWMKKNRPGWHVYTTRINIRSSFTKHRTVFGDILLSTNQKTSLPRIKENVTSSPHIEWTFIELDWTRSTSTASTTKVHQTKTDTFIHTATRNYWFSTNLQRRTYRLDRCQLESLNITEMIEMKQNEKQIRK